MTLPLPLPGLLHMFLAVSSPLDGIDGHIGESMRKSVLHRMCPGMYVWYGAMVLANQ